MKARCPTCDKVIDPTHAPVARISGARVLTFCSQACADGEPAPAPAPTPAPELAPAPAPEPAPELAPAPAPAPRRSWPRRMLIALSGLVVAGGVTIAVLDGFSGWRSTEVDAREVPAPAPAPATPEPAAAAEPETPKPAALRRAAIEQLQALRESPSPRIARLATMALAKTGDPGAIENLARLLESETSALNRVAIAFALARAGDQRGLDHLVASLSARRRDVRADAAIALTQLDDRRGDKVLRSILHIRNHKIAAAGHLARGGDQKARELLDEIFRDRRADRESRMRAAVALGAAGVAEVADFLKETLRDGRYRVGAAAALAVLGDEAAREPLVRQLELNAMRVQAAEALVTLGGEVDLTPLAVALTHDDEVARMTAAEAILILTAAGD